MAFCTFVRKNCSGYEYGVMRINDSGTRVYEVRGKEDSLPAALAANNMALEAQRSSGKSYAPL